jgi:hypothetical protein
MIMTANFCVISFSLQRSVKLYLAKTTSIVINVAKYDLIVRQVFKI